MRLCTALFSSALLIGSAAFAQTPSDQTSSTTKTTDTATTKTKSHVVVGKVKDYSEGKSITVTTAKGKDETFDITGSNVNANVSPGVAVGSEVKVIEKKDNNGNRTVMVEPYGKGHRARSKTST